MIAERPPLFPYLPTTTFTTTTWTSHNTAYPAEVDGCEECNRSTPKPWPVYTVNYHGVECCAKCLTPMDVQRRQRG